MTKIRASKTGKSLLILQDNVMYQPSLMGFFTSVSKQTKHPPFHLFTAVVIYDRKSSRKKFLSYPRKKTIYFLILHVHSCSLIIPHIILSTSNFMMSTFLRNFHSKTQNNKKKKHAKKKSCQKKKITMWLNRN